MTYRWANALRSATGHAYRVLPHFLSYVRGKAMILMYHRVVPPLALSATYVQPGMYVTPDTFERHLRFLTDHFELVSLHDLLGKWEARAQWNTSSRYCAVTFDDGWLDNYVYAYPRLRAYSV